MLKTFMLFGMICIEDPSAPIFKENCFNYWEDPVVHYKGELLCGAAALHESKRIRKELTSLGLTITEGEIWCIETTKSQKA